MYGFHRIWKMMLSCEVKQLFTKQSGLRENSFLGLFAFFPSELQGQTSEPIYNSKRRYSTVQSLYSELRLLESDWVEFLRASSQGMCVPFQGRGDPAASLGEPISGIARDVEMDGVGWKPYMVNWKRCSFLTPAPRVNRARRVLWLNGKVPEGLALYALLCYLSTHDYADFRKHHWGTVASEPYECRSAALPVRRQKKEFTLNRELLQMAGFRTERRAIAALRRLKHGVGLS